MREAQARKKFKAAQRLEKLKKKSDLLANEEGMTEKEKAESIAKLLGKARKKAPKRSVKVVVAKGVNRGIQGRPKVSILASFNSALLVCLGVKKCLFKIFLFLFIFLLNIEKILGFVYPLVANYLFLGRERSVQDCGR